MPNDRGLRRSTPDKSFSTSAGRALESVPTESTNTASNPPTQPAPASSATPRRRRPHLPPIAGQTTRITVDVPSTEHRALKRVADDIADEIGIGTVPLGHLLEAMAHQVLNDTSLRLRDSVTEYLRGRVEN